MLLTLKTGLKSRARLTVTSLASFCADELATSAAGKDSLLAIESVPGKIGVAQIEETPKARARAVMKRMVKVLLR